MVRTRSALLGQPYFHRLANFKCQGSSELNCNRSASSHDSSIQLPPTESRRNLGQQLGLHTKLLHRQLAPREFDACGLFAIFDFLSERAPTLRGCERRFEIVRSYARSETDAAGRAVVLESGKREIDAP